LRSLSHSTNGGVAKDMKLNSIVKVLNGTVLTHSYDGDMEIESCGAADLMSDVLAFTTEVSSVLLSGLTNQQILRTVEVANIKAIVFVRGKVPPQSTITLANELIIPLVVCNLSMYEACGLLHRAGLPDNGVASMTRR